MGTPGISANKSSSFGDSQMSTLGTNTNTLRMFSEEAGRKSIKEEKTNVNKTLRGISGKKITGDGESTFNPPSLAGC